LTTNPMGAMPQGLVEGWRCEPHAVGLEGAP